MLWNEYQDKVRAAHQESAAVWCTKLTAGWRIEHLILALVFAAKSDGHLMPKNVATIEQQLREAGVEEQGRILIERAIEQPLDPSASGAWDP
ncbi:DUF533 domain-containing protein [Shigella flexneri]